MEYDVVLVTQQKYVQPTRINAYIQNILTEDEILSLALQAQGHSVVRVGWEDASFKWSSTRCIIIRAIWNIFEHLPAFRSWLDKVHQQTRIINAPSLIKWNLDKGYLQHFQKAGIQIPPTVFLNQGNKTTLEEQLSKHNWQEIVMKPAISAGGRHTYRFITQDLVRYEEQFRNLINLEPMLLQKFQPRILDRGEVTFVVIGGQFTHAVLKRAKPGEFRVQDDFGGTVQVHQATKNEIIWAEQIVRCCTKLPAYARVDGIWLEDGSLALSELELIEPELWFRFDESAARRLAVHITC